MDEELLSTKEAAAYVGLSVQGLKHHLYQVKDLSADAKVGQTLIFRKSTLDAFLETKRSPGRPPSSAEPS